MLEISRVGNGILGVAGFYLQQLLLRSGAREERPLHKTRLRSTSMGQAAQGRQ
jgi:hypothetical protein